MWKSCNIEVILLPGIYSVIASHGHHREPPDPTDNLVFFFMQSVVIEEESFVYQQFSS